MKLRIAYALRFPLGAHRFSLVVILIVALHSTASRTQPLPLDELPILELPTVCIEEIDQLPDGTTEINEHLSASCREHVRLLTSDMDTPVKKTYDACIEELPIDDVDDDSPFLLSLHLACRRLAEGDLEGAYEIGSHFDNGWGVDQDGFRAAQSYKRAAQHGHVDSQVALGHLYSGTGGLLPENRVEAYQWYRQAAEGGDAFSQKMIADAYVKGAVVPRSYSDAIAWYRRAIENGYFLAPYSLARLYAEGRGVRRDLIQAYAWNSLSASTGNVMALDYQDELEKMLNSDQVAEAQELAKRLDVQFGDRIRQD